MNVQGEITVAKKQKQEEPKEFTLRDAQHYAARGMHHALGAIEQALQRECPICDEVWHWITSNFWGNPRAKNLVTEHAPQFAPAPATAK